MIIKGNTVGTTMPRANWDQEDPKKADYIKGRDGVNKAIEDAQTAADNAQTAADNAQSAADNAQTAADNAQTAADNAQIAADNAQTAAENAEKNAKDYTDKKTISRANLESDALYSPIKGVGSSNTYNFVASDLGKTVTCIGTSPTGVATYILTEDVALSLPLGAEIAVAWTNGTGGVQIKFDGNIRSAMSGDSGYVSGRTYNISERYSMVALKLIGNSSPTYWLVTGNVEVV